MRTPKLVKIKYEAIVAVFDQNVLKEANGSLYELFDEVFYNSAENVTGVQMLIDSTALTIEGSNE